MRARRWRRVVVGVVAAGLLLVSCGDGEESSAPTTRAATTTTLSQTELDRAKAQEIVLTAADVPGFTTVAPDPGDEGPDITEAVNACLKNNPLLMRMGEENDPRGAVSPEFETDEMTVGSTATFGEAEDEVRAAMTALSAASFPGCFSRAAAEGMRTDPSFTNVTVTTNRLPALDVGDETIAYRSVVRATYQGTAVTLYVDYTFVRSGRAMAVLEDLNVGAPFPEAERQRLAALIAGRMAGP